MVVAVAANPRAPLNRAFDAAVRELDALGFAKVVSGLSVPISAGEALWRSGAAKGFSETSVETQRPEIHLEVFSANPIFEGWDTLDDVDDDLFTDVPGAVALVDADGDRVLSPEEVGTFYRTDPAATALRRTLVRFRSEWNLDIEATLARLDEIGFSTAGLSMTLLPYRWWPDAADVLPASSHVWHINPVEFLGAYQTILDPVCRAGSTGCSLENEAVR